MRSRRLRGRHYQTGAVLEVDLVDGRVREVVPVADNDTTDWLAPPLLDLQINGYAGLDFTTDGTSDATPLWQTLAERGIDQICPTIITASADTIASACQAWAATDSTGSRIVGLHLEGPFLSPEDGPRGAHPRPHIRPADWDMFQRWQAAAQGRIRLITLAPEVPNALPFIERATAAGVVVALGHTLASARRIADAVAAGARLATHLGNGCGLFLHRHANPLWPLLAEDRLAASFIADGQHVPWELARCIHKCKGTAGCILISDASPLGGLPPGRRLLWEQPVEITPRQQILLADTGLLAGAWPLLDTGVINAVACLGLPWIDAWTMAAINPRRLLGLPIPELRVGAPWAWHVYRPTGSTLRVLDPVPPTNQPVAVAAD